MGTSGSRADRRLERASRASLSPFPAAALAGASFHRATEHGCYDPDPIGRDRFRRIQSGRSGDSPTIPNPVQRRAAKRPCTPRFALRWQRGHSRETSGPPSRRRHTRSGPVGPIQSCRDHELSFWLRAHPTWLEAVEFTRLGRQALRLPIALARRREARRRRTASAKVREEPAQHGAERRPAAVAE